MRDYELEEIEAQYADYLDAISKHAIEMSKQEYADLSLAQLFLRRLLLTKALADTEESIAAI